jgi:hypothetical protein
MMEGPGVDSEEKHEPVSDIDIAVVDSLKVLDPKRPIREEKQTWRRSLSRSAKGQEETFGCRSFQL